MVKISLSSGRLLPAYLRHIFAINGQYSAVTVLNKNTGFLNNNSVAKNA